MSSPDLHDAWSAGQSYDHYMGRWSRGIATDFTRWLDLPDRLDWLDIGCGTGALASAILADCSPRSVLGIDPSDGFVAHARSAIGDARATFEIADAANIPCDTDSRDVVASALAINFVGDRQAALAEMKRVAKPGGTIAFYVWDYPGGGMGFIDAFWRAAVALDPRAEAMDEQRRFPFCTRDGILQESIGAGLSNAVVEPIQIRTRFETFDDFWQPFTLGAGPAPGYCLSLTDESQLALRRRLEADLGPGQPIDLPARAWAMKATQH